MGPSWSACYPCPLPLPATVRRPGHDPNDYEIGKRLGLPTINIMNPDATLNENAGDYNGMDRFEARKRVWAYMEEQGLAIRKEDYTMRCGEQGQ